MGKELYYMSKISRICLSAMLIAGAYNTDIVSNENNQLKEQFNVASKKNGDLESQLAQKQEQIDGLTIVLNEVMTEIH